MTTLAAPSFRIPVALDGTGRLVAPDDARRRDAYRCPACDGRVDLHAGEKKRRHFHHRASSCSPEGVVHLSAKLLVAQAVREWIEEGAPAPEFVRRCACGGCEHTCRQTMPGKVRGVAIEHRLPSGRVVDVALLAAGVPLPVAAIEIVCTHRVDADKRGDIAVPWIEVRGAQVCKDAGRVLVGVQDRLLPWFCARHAGARGVADRVAREERRRLRALVRKLPFRLADFPGFRAECVARCPRGHDAIVYAWDGAHPPSPRPPHVVATQRDLDWDFDAARGRWSKRLPWRRKYFSVCGVCGEAVG